MPWPVYSFDHVRLCFQIGDELFQFRNVELVENFSLDLFLHRSLLRRNLHWCFSKPFSRLADRPELGVGRLRIVNWPLCECSESAVRIEINLGRIEVLCGLLDPFHYQV